MSLDQFVTQNRFTHHKGYTFSLIKDSARGTQTELIQYKGWKCTIKEYRVTEIDRLNGIEQSVAVVITAEAFRYSQESWVAWTAWRAFDKVLFSYKAIKGKWIPDNAESIDRNSYGFNDTSFGNVAPDKELIDQYLKRPDEPLLR